MVNGLPDARLEGIFFMFGGIPNTIFESQVLVHVRNMQQVGIDMEVWTFAGSSWEYRAALDALPRIENNFPTIKVRVFRGVRPALPSSEWLNALLLLWRMWRLGAKPSFVHARTEHATAVAALAKSLKKYALIWDARGASLSEFRAHARELPRTLRWLVPVNIRAITRRMKMANRRCDAAIFVSDELRSLDGLEVPVERTLIVPCLADESLFYFDPELREEARKSLGYANDDDVIVYVGSTEIWQCIPEMILLMQNALSVSASVKVLIVSHGRTVFESAFTSDLRDRVCITSGSLREVNRYLNAADFGVLLRKPNLINKVASPVKFAEYSLAGLTVVTTDAVEQVRQIGRTLGNIVEPDVFLRDYVQKGVKPAHRSEISAGARVILGRRSHIDTLAEFYGRLR